jgi:hypothetical protein
MSRQMMPLIACSFVLLFINTVAKADFLAKDIDFDTCTVHMLADNRVASTGTRVTVTLNPDGSNATVVTVHLTCRNIDGDTSQAAHVGGSTLAVNSVTFQLTNQP